MKRSPLTRHKGLSRSLPLRAYRDTDLTLSDAQGATRTPPRPCPVRTSPIPTQSAAARRRSAGYSRVRKVVYRRADGRCEACAVTLPVDEWECHHRKLRSQGGRDDPENLLALCSSCHHERIHAHPEWAREHGYIVSREDDPVLIPVRVAGRGLVVLDGVVYRRLRGAA